MIKGIHHVSLRCDDRALFDKSKAFYCGVLGMRVYREWATGVMLDTGSGCIEIFSNGEGIPEQGAVRHFALATDDVDGCVEAVREAGYAVTDGPRDVTLPASPPLDLRVAFCIGPLGEEIEFFHVKE